MSNQTIADRITTALGLATPPIGLTFTDTPPAGVAGPSKPVPSTCSFWRLAEQGVFYAPAEAHNNCPLGAMVMGFPLSEEVHKELGEAMNAMCECAYLDAAEASKVPGVSPSAAGILYGPLAELPADPTLVLFWLTPSQTMIYNEAAGTASWTQANPVINGRPACAALPNALNSGNPTASFGCMGMRTFTEISDDRLLAAVPGTRIDAFTDDLERIVAANQTMKTYYEGKKAALSAVPTA